MVAGAQYTLSAYVRTNVSGKVHLLARTYTAGGSVLTDYSSSNVAAAGAIARVSVTFTADATAASVEVHIRGITLPTEYIEADAVQLEPGPTATDYAGAGTVTVVNRVRSALSSSAAVTWQRPVGVFRLQGTPRIVHTGGYAQLQDIDLVESF